MRNEQMVGMTQDSDKGSNTAENSKPVPGVPFAKGDPRINRNGRPRKSDMLKDALLEKWDAPIIGTGGKPIKDADGNVITHGGEVIAKMFKDSKLYPELLNRAFGKVKDEVEVSTRNIEIRRINPEDIEDPPIPLEEVTETCAE